MNHTIFFFFYNFAHQSPLSDKVIIFFAQTFPYIVVLTALLFLLLHHHILTSLNPFKEFAKKWKEITLVFFSGVFAWGLAYLLKLLIHSARPFVEFDYVRPLFAENGYSFPSGHATFFAAIAVSLFFTHKRAGYFFIVSALLIGLARIIAGVHFPIDILGGFVLGSTIAYFLKKR
jgi:undecaprenyl-diphosphatase